MLGYSKLAWHSFEIEAKCPNKLQIEQPRRIGPPFVWLGMKKAASD